MKTNKGFTLLISIVVTSLLLIVSFVIANIAFRQLVLASFAQESQYAFYNADSGTECALYGDLNNGATSAFATGTPSNLTCNNQTVSVGGGGANATSTFTINFTRGCAIVRVGKANNGDTTIDSRGYNVCSASPRRLERAVLITY